MKLLILLAILLSKGPLPQSYSQDVFSTYGIIRLTAMVEKLKTNNERLIKKNQDDLESGRDRDLSVLMVGNETEETIRLAIKVRDDLFKRLIQSYLKLP